MARVELLGTIARTQARGGALRIALNLRVHCLRTQGRRPLSHPEQCVGHLGAVRHRAAAVEYRVEQHPTILRDKLAALRAGQTSPENDPVPARPANRLLPQPFLTWAQAY